MTSHIKTIVDSSAVIAFLNQEKGHELVERELEKSAISSINFSEVITIANRNIFTDKKSREEGSKLLQHILPNIIDFNREQACIAGSFDEITKKHGLSLGDRACLALAKYKNCPVITADKSWEKLDFGIKIKLIR